MRKSLLLLIICFVQFNIQAQDSIPKCSNNSFSYNIDLVSRYLWRGLLLNPNPNIQPYATLTLGNFSLGTWASYGISEKYAEVDFNINYVINNLTLTVSDYYAKEETKKYNYLEFNSKKTNHALEGSLNYKFSKNVPVNVTVATFFFGNDRDTLGDNYYSTYLELAYPFSVKDYSFNTFIGGTTGKGYYAGGPAIVNVGISFVRYFKINEKLSLPLSGSLVLNPDTEDIFLIVKITF
jgi:hypothetical protein